MAKRIYADTNIIIRYLTNDSPKQAQIVEDVLKSLKNNDQELYICSLVFAETVYVLESFYKRSKDEISQVLLAFCQLPGIVIEDQRLMENSLNLYVRHKVDFTDAFVAAHMRRKGFEKIFTFDKDFQKFKSITRVRLPSN